MNRQEFVEIYGLKLSFEYLGLYADDSPLGREYRVGIGKVSKDGAGHDWRESPQLYKGHGINAERVGFKKGVWVGFRWRVTVSRGSHNFVAHYTMGIAHCEKTNKLNNAVYSYLTKPKLPELFDVLHSLSLDCQCVMYYRQGNTDHLAEFMSEFGYVGDEDSMKRGFKAWDACHEQKEKLALLFGYTGLEQFVSVDWENEDEQEGE